MVLDGLLTILQTLFGWLFLFVMQMLLRIVDILERFFYIFSGAEPVYYQGEPKYLFNLFFANSAISNLFWAMAIIAIVLSFGFCIVAVARKVTDISGTTKHTLGQIMSQFIRSLLVILLLNICIIAAINVTGVIFDRINYSMTHAENMGVQQERRYTEEEFATMTRILATMGNYVANPSAESRYNVNACFNAIRGELSTLLDTGCFDYDFPVVQTGKHTWQSALAQVAKSANLQEDLQLDTYYPNVQEAIILCFKQLKTNSAFKPQETAVRKNDLSENMTTAMMIFLTSSMGAEENKQFQNGTFDDALRRSYINGEKSIFSFDDVLEDFSITKINYVVGLIVALAEILFLGKVILLFIVRMLNLIMLYIVSPLFASSMTLDEGSRFQNWTQSFVMQLVAAYAGVVMMRVYLIILPVVINGDFTFFPPGSSLNAYNIYGELVIILAGAWAVSRASSLISGALTGNASGALQDADSTFGRTISDAVGAGRLHRELERFRNNRDRARSFSKGRNDSVKQEKKEAQQEKNNARPASRESRNGGTSDRQTRDDSSINNLAMERMRQNAGLDAGTSDKAYVDDADRESARLSKMRERMGFSGPAGNSSHETPDNFSLDTLPDLGKERAANRNDSFSTDNLPDLGAGRQTTAQRSSRNTSVRAEGKAPAKTGTASAKTGTAAPAKTKTAAPAKTKTAAPARTGTASAERRAASASVSNNNARQREQLKNQIRNRNHEV